MPNTRTESLNIAVLLPCYNEATTDGTASQAMLAGATVFRERRQGKGHVVRRMFADIYVMADGDGTYATEMVSTEAESSVDGNRRAKAA